MHAAPATHAAARTHVRGRRRGRVARGCGSLGGRGRSSRPRTISCAAALGTACSTVSRPMRAPREGQPMNTRPSIASNARDGSGSMVCSPSIGARGRRGGRTPTCCIDGDPELQLAVRFAIFHLLASAPDRGRGSGRGSRAERQRLPRARVLGHRRVRPAVACRDPPAGGAGDARVPRPATARGDARAHAPSGATALGSRGSPRGPVET